MRLAVLSFIVLTSCLIVGCGAPPTAQFTADITTGNPPLDVQFTDTSLVDGPYGIVNFEDYTPITSWVWTFGDGGGSTEVDPAHTYADAGTYTVSLTVTNSEGSDTATMVDFIDVTEEQPIADFTYSNTTGTAPLTVHFTNTSIPGTNPANATYAWDFEVGTSDVGNPSFTFSNPGVFTVSLTITTPLGDDTKTVLSLVVVS